MLQAKKKRIVSVKIFTYEIHDDIRRTIFVHQKIYLPLHYDKLQF